MKEFKRNQTADRFSIGKCIFMEIAHGQSYHLMRQIKELIDPKGLMNPGKIFM